MLQEIFEFFNQKAISTIIVACCGIVVVMLTQYWTKKREVQASIRLRQSEVYSEFMANTIVKLTRALKHDQFQQATNIDLQDYMIGFAGDLIIWGSSNVIHAYRRFQVVGTVSASNAKEFLSSLDNLLLEIRTDLGHDNKDLKEYDLYDLFLSGDINTRKVIEYMEQNL